MNSNGAHLVAACALLFSTAQIAAQEQAVLGQGNVSCDAWLNERQGNDGQVSSRIGWILGYVTAFNQYESKPAGDVSAGMGTDDIVLWIDDHCSQRPDDNLYKASAAFVEEFRQRLGR